MKGNAADFEPGAPSSSSRGPPPPDDNQDGGRGQDHGGDGRDDHGDQRGDPNEVNEDFVRVPSLEEYMENRVFTFIHHYSGSEDRLAEAIQKEAKRRGVRVKCISADISQGDDLLAPKPFEEHMKMAADGDVDGFHAGWPCTTFSRLRWRPSPGLPGPVRSKAFPNGFISNTASQQSECDRGTLFLARSLAMGQKVTESRGPGVGGAFYTFENPPPSGVEQHLSAWEMPEYLAFMERHHPRHVDFNTCCYEEDLEIGKRHFKPQRFAGNLHNLLSLKDVCRCGDAGHDPIVGSAKSKASAAYPRALASDYAVLAVSHFKAVGKFEHLKIKHTFMEEHLVKIREIAKAKGVDLERKAKIKGIKRTYEGEEVDFGHSSVHDWRGGDGPNEALRSSKSKASDPNQAVYVGGMRHPARVVRTMATAQSLGVRIRAAWNFFVDKHLEVEEMAENYGGSTAALPSELVDEWKETLKRIVGAENSEDQTAVKLVSKFEYKSGLDAELVEGWIRKVNDPDWAIPIWIRQGVPLGIHSPIQCCGIFPPSEETSPELAAEDSASFLSRGELINYASVEQNKQLAEEEIDRYASKGYVAKIPKEEVGEMFQHTTVSKLALILKQREDGSVKKRIAIDLRRSLGNSKAVLPERLILPRPQDCVEMVRDQYAVSSKGQGEDPSELWGCEFILIDVTDAFMSFGVERKEWGHCLAPGTKPDEMLLFTALLFGFKTAPLLYSRLAALLSRWLQSIVPPGIAAHQTYLDDALWFLQGPLKGRNRCLGLILFTMEAIGLRIAYSKGHRAGSVQWIGVTFSIVNRDSLVLGLPKPFLQETLQTLVDWGQRGYIAIRDLRSMAGRLSWVAGVLPRSRWTVTVVYAVMKAAEMEKMESEKGDRRAPKNMVAVKRFELARKWLVAFLQEALAKPMRTYSLNVSSRPSVSITTDASPEALGGYLVINGKLISAFSSKVTVEDSELLNFEKGSSSSQGIVESLALLVALRAWKGKFPPGVLELRFNADSTTALALSRRLSASTPGLNFLGAEIGIVLEELQVEKLRGVHIPGVANDMADWLSRPEKSLSPRPPALKDVKILSTERRSVDFYVLPSPRSSPSLWGQTEEAPLHNAWEALR